MYIQQMLRCLSTSQKRRSETAENRLAPDRNPAEAKLQLTQADEKLSACDFRLLLLLLRFQKVFPDG